MCIEGTFLEQLFQARGRGRVGLGLGFGLGRALTTLTPTLSLFHSLTQTP